jgi:isopenicillin-N N-acyltransferase like protein
VRQALRSVLFAGLTFAAWGLAVAGLVGRPAAAETVARCGAGWLESIDGYPVLHLKGTPYEIGYQHGALLKQSVRENMHNLLDVKGQTPLKIGPISLWPRAAIDSIVKIQQRHILPKYNEEFAGLAAAAELPVADIRAGNFIPELFHCSGFAVMNSATQDGTLYHGRVLDYAVDWQLQDHAVLIVCEPAGEIPFVNVSYAGFIGSVTGMNVRHVSIGEMGGRGLGHWDGQPMALLVREVLQTAHDLDGAIEVFRDRPRTCEYYYVIADGNSNQAVGMEAAWNKFNLIKPGESHPLLPVAVKDAALLSAGSRYQELARRTQAAHGKIDVQGALRLMDCPVAMKSNLHNALFAPKSTNLWVANASHDKQPAAEQPYHEFNLNELLKRHPDPTAREIPLILAEEAATRE